MPRSPSPQLAASQAMNASMNRSWYGEQAALRRTGPSLRPVATNSSGRTSPMPAPGTTRRYYFPGISATPIDPQHPAVQHQSRVQSHHFDVRLPKLTTEGADSSYEDHLEFRYVDFLGQHPPTLAEIGVLTQDDELDVGEIAHFLNAAEPRTRLEAYPMWIMGKEIIRLLLLSKVGLRDRDLENLRKLLKDAQAKMREMESLLLAQQKENTELRSTLSEDETLLAQDEEALKAQQLELYELHSEIDKDAQELALRKSQTTVQAQRIDRLEAERERLALQEQAAHELQMDAQQKLAKQMRMSERDKKELTEAMESAVHQKEIKSRVMPLVMGWSKAEQTYALASLLENQGFESGSLKLKSTVDAFWKRQGNDFKKEHAKAAQLKEQRQSFVAAHNAEKAREQEATARELEKRIVETEQLSKELAESRAEVDDLLSQVAEQSRGGSRPGTAEEGAAGGADGADIGIWDMVVTSDDGSFDVRANLDDEAASTVKLEAGTALKVLDEQVDGSGVLWVKTDTPGGWVRREIGKNAAELYGMWAVNSPLSAAGGGGGGGGGGGQGGDKSADAGAGGADKSAAGGDGEGVDAGDVKDRAPHKSRDTRASKLLAAFEKGKAARAKPMPVQNIVHLIDKMYQAKISADEVDDRQKHRRESLPVFIKLFLITEFGLKSIADKNMKALVAGVHQFSREEEVALGNISVNDRLRILVFGEMAGMGDGHYSWVVVDCIMDFVRQLFGNTKTIRDKLNTEECLVPYDHALGCLFDTFGRYGFEVPAGASEKLGEVTHKLEPAPGGGRRVKRLFFDPVLDITLRWAREALVLKEKALRDAFALHDTNGDGCLDSVEFAKLVAAVAGQSDEFLGNGRAERDILHMYADAIEGAGLDDDRLDEDAFVAVCYRYDINLSPHQYDKSA